MGRAIKFRSRMQGGGGIVKFARKAAASARTEWAARVGRYFGTGAAMLALDVELQGR
jgi:hypothetical protein